jgi:nitrous oxide reductase
MIERNRDVAPRVNPASTRSQQDASYSFGKNNKVPAKVNKSYQQNPTVSARNRSNNRPQVEQSPKARNQFANKRLEDEEPICVLKVELDGGENIQHIKVYEGQLPEEIVDEFGRKFNLSERAKFRLLEQINEQINA